ncbi:MAG: dynamin family protein [Acidimicrobiales bacterium]
MTTPATTTPSTSATPAKPATRLAALRRDVLAVAADVRSLALEFGRDDLAERVDVAAGRCTADDLTVLVVGEFKQGKSTLVNAILNAQVCGVADDVSTIVPTLVRHGDEPSATIVYETTGSGDEPRREVVPIGDVAKVATEQGNPGNRAGIRSVEVVLPRKLLQTGLVLVDTPGVGGLDSTHGATTSGALGMAEVVVFVTDASAPLSASELDFLRTARSRCPDVVLVLTKTDIHPSWRRVLEADRQALTAAGIDVPIMPVSSVVRQRATAENSSELNEESGYPPLLTFLRDAATGESAKRAVRTAVGDLAFVLEQIHAPLASERQVLEDPEALAALLAELEASKKRAEALRSQSAKWQQTLNDGAQDLTADLDHDLRMRVRSILAEAETALDTYDPIDVWDGFEQWLHQRLAFDLASHHQNMAARADALATKVAEHFAADEAAVDMHVELPVTPIHSRHFGTEIGLERPGISGNALAAVRGSYGGLLMFGMIGNLVGIGMFNPISLVVGLGLGRRTLREERKRQLTQRQQASKIAVRKYLDDVNIEAGKVSRDTARNIHRDLRDEFATRAEQLQATIRESLRSAEMGAKQAAADRQVRLNEVQAAEKRIVTVRQKVDAATRTLGPVPS